MLNKDFYFAKLDEIQEALDETEWYNSTEYKERYDAGWWEGFVAGFISPVILVVGVIGLWMFIHSASH